MDHGVPAFACHLAEASKRSVPKNNTIFKADRGAFGLLNN